jgi:hypothetical protein
MTQRLLDAVFVLREGLFDPLMFKELTTGSHEIVREEENGLRGSTDFGAFVLGEASCPLL